MKREVYTWRVSTEIKSDLERQARVRGTSVSAILDLAVRDWMKGSSVDTEDEEEQKRLHAAAEKCIGTIAGDNPHRSENASELIRKRLKRQYGR